VIGGWIKLHNEDLHNSYSSPSIIIIIKSMRMRLARHVARMGRRGMNIGFGGKRGKGPLGRPRHRWKDNIKTDLGETGWGGMDWTGLIWLRIGTSEVLV
jgi:hypothetical protein